MSIKAFVSSLLAAVFLCTSVAEARAMRCEGLFEDSLQKVFEELDAQSEGRLFRGKGLEDFTNELSWNRRRKLRKYLQKVSISQIPSAKALENEVLTLGDILFGRLDIADRWILKSSEQREAQSAEVLAKRDLIRDGLTKMWADSHNPENIGRLKKVLDGIWRFQNSRVGSVLSLPVFLPKMKDQEIPHDLMYKIIRDGFEAHAEEARIHLNKQSKIEAYNTFRRLWTPVFLGIVFTVMYQNAYEEVEQKQQKQVDDVVSGLRALKAFLNGRKDAILEEAWQETRAEFIAKWGEPPTPEEEAILKAQIEREVFKKNLSDKPN
ncbi:hypothetical protein [Bdellovibrio sp. HCB2-146]|uniref:hypothetical protein n=1 Tax=Bdellovibrio sp. HCB2-146 TaxID=3394362 RepID=UPI0039BC2E91